MTPQQASLLGIFGKLGGRAIRELGVARRSRVRDLGNLGEMVEASVSEDVGEAITSGPADGSGDAPCDCAARAAQLRREAAARFGRRR